MLIRADNITHTYRNGNQQNTVLKGVNITINPGETVGLLGQSGSGKSTLGQILCGLLKSTSGAVTFQNEQLTYPFRGRARSKIQILFQHPESVFNPCIRLRDSIREIYGLYKIEYSERVMQEMLEPFGIYREHLDRYPMQLSGGELQRIALARILLVKPEFIVLDEPTSMLDSISQAQIIRLLDSLQKIERIGYLFITHNCVLCEAFSDRIYMIEQGKITEREEGKKSL